MLLSQATIPFLLIDALGPLYYSEFNITTGWDALLLSFDFFLILNMATITSKCSQHSGFKRTTSIHTTFGILVLFLVLYHCGPRWLVGGERIYSLSIYREISYSGVSLLFFYFSLS